MNKSFIYVPLLISIFISLISCNNGGKTKYRGFQQYLEPDRIRSIPKTSEDSTQHVRIPKEDSMKFDFNGTLRDLKYIKLQTTQRSKISTYDKVIITNDRIILGDKYLKKEIYLFDHKGNFIEKIVTKDNLGNGQVKISSFNDVTYDFQSDEIVMHDPSSAKLYYFDKNGRFKHFKKEFFYFYEFANIPGGSTYIYINPLGGNKHLPVLNHSSIYLGKKDARVEYTAKDAILNMKTDVDYFINTNNSIKNSNSKMYYTPDFSNDVYRISGEPQIRKVLSIDLPSPNINEKLKDPRNQSIEAFTRLTNSLQYYYFVGNVLCNDQDIYFIPTMRNGISGYFYSPEKHKIIAGGSVAGNGKTETILGEYQYPITTFKDYFVSVFQPRAFLNVPKNQSKWMLELSKGLTAKDNPILVFYKINN